MYLRKDKHSVFAFSRCLFCNREISEGSEVCDNNSCQNAWQEECMNEGTTRHNKQPKAPKEQRLKKMKKDKHEYNA